MRIGEINQNNYNEFMRLFSKTGPKATKPSQLLSTQSVSQIQVDSVNPYANPGQDITGRTDWKKIVPVPDDITDKLKALVKRDFVERKGMSGEYNERNDVINNYLQSLPSEERPSASWTLQQVVINEANGYVNKIRQFNPNWTNGQPFDTSILTGNPSNNKLDQTV